jgi:phenylpyruvate tautomerase PptA (4-oxalocrotonate tautomerase family)
MPIVTLTLRGPKPTAFKSSVLDAIHAALVAAGVDPADRFQRVIELSGDDFRYDPTFPDLATPRGETFLLIEVLLGTGRSVRVKKKILADVVAGLKRVGVDPEHAMIVFQDVPWENWSPGGGRMPHG